MTRMKIVLLGPNVLKALVKQNDRIKGMYNNLYLLDDLLITSYHNDMYLYQHFLYIVLLYNTAI